jgi:hypothetical protein
VDALRLRKDRDTGVNEDRRLQQLKVGILDGERRTKRMEKEFDNIVQRWQGKVAIVRKGIEEESKRSKAVVLAELTEKLMQQIQEKNRQAVEISRVKEEVETQITNAGFQTTNDIPGLQRDLDNLLSQYQTLVSDKLSLFGDLLANLREITRQNESVLCADEEIARLKVNLDFTRREIMQKKRLL